MKFLKDDEVPSRYRKPIPTPVADTVDRTPPSTPPGPDPATQHIIEALERITQRLTIPPPAPVVHPTESGEWIVTFTRDAKQRITGVLAQNLVAGKAWEGTVERDAHGHLQTLSLQPMTLGLTLHL